MVTIKYQASELALLFNLDLKGSNSLIEHLGLCNRKSLLPNTLSYIAHINYLDDAIHNDNVSAILCTNSVAEKIYDKKTCLITEYPEDAFYSILTWVAKEQLNSTTINIIGINCDIHSTAIIEPGVQIGDNVTIGAYTVIHKNSKIGNNTIIGSHCAIGSNGFQALKDAMGRSYNVPHIGSVSIGSNCYIAEFVNISRGLFDTEVTIEDNVLIDVGCHIAHDCFIGQNSVLTANTILFGSSKVERNVWMSPNSMVMNRKIVANNCHVAPGAFIINNTEPDTKYIGNPATKECTFVKREMKLKKLLR